MVFRCLSVILLVLAPSLLAEKTAQSPSLTQSAPPGTVIRVHGDGVDFYMTSPDSGPAMGLGGRGRDVVESIRPKVLPQTDVPRESFHPTPNGWDKKDEQNSSDFLKDHEEAVKKHASQVAANSNRLMNQMAAELDERLRAKDEARAREQATAIAVVSWCQNMAGRFGKEQDSVAGAQKKAFDLSVSKIEEGLAAAIEAASARSDKGLEQSDVPETKVGRYSPDRFVVKGPVDISPLSNSELDTNLIRNAESAFETPLTPHPLNLLSREGALIFLQADPGQLPPGIFPNHQILTGIQLGYVSAAFDLALGITPVVGFSRDVFEVLTGVNALTGAELNHWERGFAFAGAATGGIVKLLGGFADVGNTFVRSSVRLSKDVFPQSARTLDGTLEAANHFLRKGNVERFTPIDLPGPLHLKPFSETMAIDGRVAIAAGEKNLPNPRAATIADTFRSATYNKRILEKEEIFYRVAPKERMGGLFWTSDKPTGKLQFQIDMAVLPEFDNSAKHIGTLRLPAGTIVYEGVAANQRGMSSGAKMLGGGNQVYLDLPREEILRGLVEVEVFK